jgi:hypothetical protein
MSNRINIGQGSSKFYCNLIKAYLKNYDGVSVMAGGLRMNLGVWVCYFIQQEFLVDRINVHFIEDIKTHTVFSFYVHRKEPVYTLQHDNRNKSIIMIPKHTTMRELKSYLTQSNNIEIAAAGSMCYKALFLTSFAYKLRFKPEYIDIFLTELNGKVGIKIGLYKEDNNSNNNAPVYTNL